MPDISPLAPLSPPSGDPTVGNPASSHGHKPPIKVIWLAKDSVSNFQSNTRGFVSQWASSTTSVDWLKSQVQQAIANGFTRIFFAYPAGFAIIPNVGSSIGSNGLPQNVAVPYSAVTWSSLNETLQNSLLASFGNFLEQFSGSVEFGIWSGFYTYDLSYKKLDSVNTSGYAITNLLSADDILAYKTNWEQWFKMGIRSYIANDVSFFDPIKQTSYGLGFAEQYASLFILRDGIFYGEDFPYNKDAAGNITGMNASLKNRISWFSKWSKLRRAQDTSGLVFSNDPNLGEMIVGIDTDNSYPGEDTIPIVSLSALTNLFNQGFTLASLDDSNDNLILSFGIPN